MEKCGIIDKLSRAPGFSGRVGGFSLIELLIAMAVGLVVLGAMYSVFTIQNKTFANQENFVEMQQSVRAGMDMMTREIRMAGYDPSGANSDTNPGNNFSGVTVNTAQLQVRADTKSSPPPDGSITGDESVIYTFDTANKRITRNIGSGDLPFVENVDSFTFEYLDGSDNVTATSANVRQIRITITGRTAKPDPAYTANDGYRTYTLTSIVAPRNLAY